MVLGLHSPSVSPLPPTSHPDHWNSPGSVGSLQSENPLNKYPPTQMTCCTLTSESADHIGGLTWEAFQALGRGAALRPPQEGRDLFMASVAGSASGHLRYGWAEVGGIRGADSTGRVWPRLGYAGAAVGFVCLPRTLLGSITRKDPDPPMSGLCCTHGPGSGELT